MKLYTNIGTKNSENYGEDFVLTLTEMKHWYKDVKNLVGYDFNSFENFLSEFKELVKETKHVYSCHQHYTNAGKNHVDKIIISINSKREILNYESISTK